MRYKPHAKPIDFGYLVLTFFVAFQDWLELNEHRLQFLTHFLRDNAHGANALREERMVLDFVRQQHAQHGILELTMDHIW